jgi:LPXTG-motif cell wall-anchored protein
MSAIVVAAAAVVALLVFLAWKRKKNINEREDA